MIFQIVDDVLDLTATDEELGKPSGLDLAEGIYTLPVIYALRSSSELRALLGRPLDPDAVAQGRALTCADGAVADALAVADEHAAAAARGAGRRRHRRRRGRGPGPAVPLDHRPLRTAASAPRRSGRLAQTPSELGAASVEMAWRRVNPGGVVLPNARTGPAQRQALAGGAATSR